MDIESVHKHVVVFVINRYKEKSPREISAGRVSSPSSNIICLLVLKTYHLTEWRHRQAVLPSYHNSRPDLLLFIFIKYLIPTIGTYTLITQLKK